MRSPGQRGTFGEWLQRNRKARFKTQREALAAYRRIAGLRIAPSEYAQWESGSRVPREVNPKVARLYEFYGSRPEDEGPQPPADIAALVAALDRQTAAITRQADLVEQLLGHWAGLVMQQTAGPDVLGVLGPLVEAAEQRAAEREHPDPTRGQPAAEARR